MEKRRVGSLTVSVLGFGVGNVTEANHVEAGALLAAAIDAGITYVDISNRPDTTEQYVGQALAGHRDEVVLATKFGSRPSPGVLACATPEYTRASVERSLTNLGTDRIDLLYLHRPDPDTPIADTLGALDELVQAGKIREIGCSKFNAAQLREADAAVRTGAARFVAVENHCSLLDRGDETTVLPVCDELDIAYMAYWPLAAGLLTGKYRRGAEMPPDSRFATRRKWVPRIAEWHTDENYDALDRLVPWAHDHGRTIVELAFAWLLSHGSVRTLIAGASRAEQLRANVEATTWRLTPAEVAEVSQLAAGQS